MKQLPPEVISSLKMWLIVYVKKMLFQLKIKANVLKAMKLLGEVTCILLICWEEIKDEDEK